MSGFPAAVIPDRPTHWPMRGQMSERPVVAIDFPNPVGLNVRQFGSCTDAKECLLLGERAYLLNDRDWGAKRTISP